MQPVNVKLGPFAGPTFPLVGTATPTGSNYVLYTFYYTATTSGMYSLFFVGKATGSDNTALIDNVQVVPSADTIAVQVVTQPTGTQITQPISFLVQLTDPDAPAEVVGEPVTAQLINSAGAVVASDTLISTANGTVSSSGLPLSFLEIDRVGTYYLQLSLDGVTLFDSNSFTISPVASVVELLNRSRYR